MSEGREGAFTWKDSSSNHFFRFAQQLGTLCARVTLLSFFHEKGQKINVLAWKTGGRTNKLLSVLLALREGNRCKGEATRLDHHHKQHLVQSERKQTDLPELEIEPLNSKTCHQVTDKVLEM